MTCEVVAPCVRSSDKQFVLGGWTDNSVETPKGGGGCIKPCLVVSQKRVTTNKPRGMTTPEEDPIFDDLQSSHAAVGYLLPNLLWTGCFKNCLWVVVASYNAKKVGV